MAAALILFVRVSMREAERAPGYDLAPLVVAGRLLATGESAHVYAQDPRLYNRVADPVFQRAGREAGVALDPTPFVYPPLVAVLMRPLASVGFPTIAAVWAPISVALVLYGMYLMLAVYAPDWQRPFVWALLLLALCRFEPYLYGVALRQTTAVIFPLVVGAIWLQRRGRLAAAGAALAVAAFVKLTPAVLAAIWLWRGPRRAAASFAVALALLWALSIAVVGVPLHRDYLSRVTAIGGLVVIAFNNHSLTAFLSRPLAFQPAWFDWRMYKPEPGVTIAAAIIIGAAAIAMVLLIRGIAREDVWRPYAEAFALLLMLIAPSIAWTHYFVFALPVMAVVARRTPGDGWMPAALAGAALALCCRPVVPDQIRPDVSSLVRVSSPTIAVLVLAGALLWLAQRAAARESQGTG